MSTATDALVARHTLDALEGKSVAYGTAGFRMRAALLDGVVFRVGCVAALRSALLGLQQQQQQQQHEGATTTSSSAPWIGVMVTASHNPEVDNGVKVVDPAGEMLAAPWEPLATAAANAASAADLRAALDAVVAGASVAAASTVAELGAALAALPQAATGLRQALRVALGRDTRSSSPGLATAAADGVAYVRSLLGLGAAAATPSVTTAAAAASDDAAWLRDLGVVTTPQLHFAVREGNAGRAWDEDAYYACFAGAFAAALEGAPAERAAVAAAGVVVDASNGVGAQAAKRLAAALEPHATGLRMDVVNDGSAEGEAGTLNLGCGADFVKTRQREPEHGVPDARNGRRFASLDGDADRLIYWTFRSDDGSFAMLDGDKIAALIAAYIRHEMTAAGVGDDVLKLGVVQTAYANGASTRYIAAGMGVPVTCTPTGVKHLHHAAVENYDIGVYFEANGHGTVVFSDRYSEELQRRLASESDDAGRGAALRRLANLPRLVNQAVGDALSDMLLVEAILAHRGWVNLDDWIKLYDDAPNRLVAQAVGDRTRFQTTDAERRLTAPAGLQERIDAAVAKVENGRSFVRPSGTEDVVRIYAEASTAEQAESLAAEVTSLVTDA